MNNSDTLQKAYQVLTDLLNEDCFDFCEIKNSLFNERKEYLRDMSFSYFQSGETNLADMIERVDSDDYLFEGLASPETIQNINDFFTNEELVADIILLMDEDIYYKYIDELNNK